ncbi:MAG: hypothetical protein KDJ16_01225 [Hyphomicrobiales bacterium]|nr:hypothetical protein [Hyphomicrobiales bacterium]
MGILDYFRRPPPIATFADIEDFLDSRTAFLVQKTVYEYCRARSGVLWNKLFKEAAFIAAIDECRWRNFPIGLSYILQMVEGTLRAEAGDSAAALADGLLAAAKTVMSRYPVPAGFADDFWSTSHAEVAEQLMRAQLAAPKSVKDIPVATVQAFFDNLPIHESLRVHDYSLIKNHLSSNLCRLYEEFVARTDSAAITDIIIDGPPSVAVPHVGRS